MAPRSRQAHRAVALAVVFESFLAHGAEAMSGGERHQVVVHVSGETLRTGVGHQCEIEDGPAVAAETARRLACDASVIAIVEDAKGEPLNVGRKTRSIPPALQRALNARDKGCRFPGCTHKKYTDAHHIKHWEQAGILIDARTAAPRLDRGPMDYGIAIDYLMSLHRDVSAERAPGQAWRNLLSELAGVSPAPAKVSHRPGPSVAWCEGDLGCEAYTGGVQAA